MKKGERNALWFVVAMFAGVTALTIYLEFGTSSADREAAFKAMFDSAGGPPAPSGPGVRMIPVGLQPEALPDAASRGARILSIYCTQCHDLPTPAMHMPDEWDAVLTRMDQRMQAMRGGMISRVIMPSQADWDALRDYLHANAQAPLAAGQYPDLDTPAGKAFTTVCSQCHGAPDPAVHTASEWSRVVLRMKVNMKAAGTALPDEETERLVITFLREHGRKS